MHVEYAEKPKEYQLTQLLDGKVKIDLRESIQPVWREGGEDNEEGSVIWEADEYSLVRFYRKNLESDVRNNFSAYLMEVKAEEEAMESARTMAELETKFSRELPETVLDLQYRLAIAELMI